MSFFEEYGELLMYLSIPITSAIIGWGTNVLVGACISDRYWQDFNQCRIKLRKAATGIAHLQIVPSGLGRIRSWIVIKCRIQAAKCKHRITKPRVVKLRELMSRR